MISNNKIGQKIKRARRLMSPEMRQIDLAEKINKSVRTIQLIESGEVNVTVNILQKIAYEVQQPIMYFFKE